jgi:hypothetical protein
MSRTKDLWHGTLRWPVFARHAVSANKSHYTLLVDLDHEPDRVVMIGIPHTTAARALAASLEYWANELDRTKAASEGHTVRDD